MPRGIHSSSVKRCSDPSVPSRWRPTSRWRPGSSSSPSSSVNAGVGMMGPPTQVGAMLGVTGYVLLFSVALGFRRFSPGVALALAWAGALAQMSLLRGPSLVDFAIFGVLYAAAAYGSVRVFWAGLASAVTGAVVITLYLYLGPLYSGALDLSVLPIAVIVLGERPSP